jgi:hypothetical protein
VFGLRYHVASLAAVFVALAVGILLGVAVSGKVTDVGEKAELQNLRDDNDRLQKDLSAAQAATAQVEGSEELLAKSYPALMENRLEGQNVAVLFLGPSDGGLRADIEGALADADAGAPASVVALDVPVDRSDLESTLEGDETLASYANADGDFSDLGRELGRELVEADETPLWDALATKLVEERSGTISHPMDSVVVVLNWEPPAEASDGESAASSQSTGSLMDGIMSGLDETSVPVVGVAGSDDPRSVIDFYKDRGLSSVDDIDAREGRLALALLLAGAQPGQYGLGSRATDGVVPPIDPVTTEGG